MAMTAGPSTGMGGGIPLVDINTTPLVDVMLVLLIIFMITAPLLTHRVGITLPQRSPIEQDFSQIEHRSIALRDQGGAVEIRLDGEVVSQEQLFMDFRLVGAKPRDEQTKYRIEADESVPYSALASLLATARRSHVERISFENLSVPSESADAR